jgi:hypothetical protein
MRMGVHALARRCTEPVERLSHRDHADRRMAGDGSHEGPHHLYSA